MRNTMELQRSRSAIPRIPVPDLPILKPWDNEALVKPARRQATARIRQEWDRNQRDSFDRGREMMWLKEYTKCLHQMRAQRCNQQDERQRRAKLEKHVFRNKWAAEVSKRNVPERLPYVTKIRAVTAPPRQPVTDVVETSIPMFRQTSNMRPRPSKEVERKPMHFIDKEWSSERVSWLRFHTTLSEWHKTGWIE